MKRHYGFKISKEGLESIIVAHGNARRFAEKAGLSVATVTSVFNGGFATEKTRNAFMGAMGISMEMDVKKIFYFHMEEEKK